MRLRVSLAAFLCACVLAGFGGAELWRRASRDTVPVHGRITYDALPVACARVTFVPASPTGTMYSTSTDLEGRFVFPNRTVDSQGCAPGPYVVCVGIPGPENAHVPENVRWRVRSPKTSKIRVRVSKWVTINVIAVDVSHN